MRSISLRASAPDELRPELLPIYHGQLPEHWGEVPLGAYALLASATSVRQRIEATAALCSLPLPVMLADAGLFRAVVQAAPWLFDAPLPTLATVSSFDHLGTTYAHVGGLHRISAGQLEALLDFLQEHHAAPLLSAPALLAVLYCRKGAEQTADEVEAAAAAFQSLPVSIAWPALLDFLRSGAMPALHIRNSLALQSTTRALINEMEAAVAGASFSSWRKPQGWLIRTWIQSVKKML